jgi:DNA-directed RNA polymerase subunit N (RpoN/RPB10)
MRDKDELERKWERHIEKLKTKKSKDQEIKTPIPSNPDRCFVCNSVISPEEGYREHLKSEEHKRHIEVNCLYQEIDNVINELNLEIELKEIQKKSPPPAPTLIDTGSRDINVKRRPMRKQPTLEIVK